MFLDRDGVINRLVVDARSGRPESPYRPAAVGLCSGAAAALRALTRAGAIIVLVSNQPAAAKGTCSIGDLLSVHEEVIRQLRASGVPEFASAEYCYHHPEGVVPALSRPCGCRKPASGMLLRAAERLGIDPIDAWMIGDSDVDVLAGQNIGARTILIEEPMSAHRRVMGVDADFRTHSLLSAAEIVMAHDHAPEALSE